jgi:hypothetical protein
MTRRRAWLCVDPIECAIPPPQVMVDHSPVLLSLRDEDGSHPCTDDRGRSRRIWILVGRAHEE